MHGSGSALDDASVWALLATSFEAVGDINSAIALYQGIISGIHSAILILLIEVSSFNGCHIADSAPNGAVTFRDTSAYIFVPLLLY